VMVASLARLWVELWVRERRLPVARRVVFFDGVSDQKATSWACRASRGEAQEAWWLGGGEMSRR